MDDEERVGRVMTDFLLELRSEEIPARMQLKAKDDLVRLFTDALQMRGYDVPVVEAFATPRRLALIAHGLPAMAPTMTIETKGPKVGAPQQALDGFLRKYGVALEDLVDRSGIYFLDRVVPGASTIDELGKIIPRLILDFPWPKSQRWGAASVSTESLRWVRPLQGIIALLGDDVVDCEIDGIVSGRTTMGHRFHYKGEVTIGNADGYVEALRAAHVIVHFSERTAIIRDGAEAAAKAAGLVLVPDEGLVTENAGLTEWPVPMLGRFDPAFLAVPQEVIQLTARVNQKYFVCNDADGKLANAFVCTANIVAKDGGAAIVAGNEKVLAARLSDAKFFWEQDLKVALDEQARKLSQITFHEKLGTVADKVERVAKLARWLVEEGIVTKSSPSTRDGEVAGGAIAATDGGDSNLESPSVSPVLTPGRSTSPSQVDGEDLAAMAERAARLCKADLVTGMVGEFPELQGIMGGYYARAQGEPDAVADAVRDHYKPVGQGDDVPTAPVTVAVSLADKLDTLVSFFAYELRPTGSKDPFALRRASISAATIILENGLRIKLGNSLFDHAKFLLLRSETSLAQKAMHKFFEFEALFGRNAASDALVTALQRAETTPQEETKKLLDMAGEGTKSLLDFFADRLKVQQREAGVRHDLIDAVFALGGEDDLVRLLARVKALQAFVATDEGVNLLAAYKRAANILKAADGVDAATPAPVNLVTEEAELLTALNTAEPLAAAAIEAEQFEGAMAALAGLRAPIDAFFDGVMVNDPDPEKRAFRIGLLTRFRDAVHRVADFSKIEG